MIDLFIYCFHMTIYIYLYRVVIILYTQCIGTCIQYNMGQSGMINVTSAGDTIFDLRKTTHRFIIYYYYRKINKHK